MLAVARLRARPPLRSSPPWLQVLQQNGGGAAAPHGLTAGGPALSSPAITSTVPTAACPVRGNGPPGPRLCLPPHTVSTGRVNPPRGCGNKHTSQTKRGSESSPAAPPSCNLAGPGAAASSCADLRPFVCLLQSKHCGNLGGVLANPLLLLIKDASCASFPASCSSPALLAMGGRGIPEVFDTTSGLSASCPLRLQGGHGCDSTHSPCWAQLYLERGWREKQDFLGDLKTV